MDCAAIDKELLDFHFAVGSQDKRDRVREHLRDCGGCAQQYLDLKHDIDSGAAMNERPSKYTRARLFTDVSHLVSGLVSGGAADRPSPGVAFLERLRRWLTQPMPRYRAGAAGAAVFAMLVVLLMVGALMLPRRTHAPELREPESGLSVESAKQEPASDYAWPRDAVDTARPQAVSISYY